MLGAALPIAVATENAVRHVTPAIERSARTMGARGARLMLTVTLPAAMPGILGGAIWMTALGLNVIASGVAGPAISYALGQGATLIAALWGVFVWREFRDASAGTNRLIALMFAAYTVGIVLIGRSTL